MGFDPLGERILNGLRQNHIATDLVMQTESAQTGFMMKAFTQKGDPDIAYYRKGSAASQITTHDIDGLDLYGCERLHVTGIFPAVSESALAATKRLMRRAEALELPISFDPNLRPQLWESEKKMVTTLNSLAQGVETILPGIAEGKILTGRDTPEGIAEFYHQMGVKNVIVKVGKDGAYFSEKGGARRAILPAFPVREKVDTVGAGDGFAAGVISALGGGRVPGGGHIPRQRHRGHPDHQPQRQRGPAHPGGAFPDHPGRHCLKGGFPMEWNRDPLPRGPHPVKAPGIAGRDIQTPGGRGCRLTGAPRVCIPPKLREARPRSTPPGGCPSAR